MSRSARLGPFVLEERLGKGGMGSVWAARHVLGMPVALKVLDRRGSRYVKALRREVRAAAGLRHPGIITLYDYGEVPAGLRMVEGSPWVAMQRADGTLRGRTLSHWDPIRSLALSVLDALAHAHGRGVIHRDLKPDNLLYLPDAPVPWLLTDFGLARAGFGSEASGPVVGTPAYMPPEQARGDWRAEGPATDLYALACVIWELVYGEPPFVGSKEDQVRGHLYREPEARAPELAVPPDLQIWLHHMLAKRPRDRPQSAAHAAAALLALGDPDVAFTPVLRPRGQAQTPSTVVFGAPMAAEEVRSAALGAGSRLPFVADWRPPDHLDPIQPTEAGLRLFPLRVPRLVGRHGERQVLWQALGDVVRRRRTRWLTVGGPPGIGARRLAGWVAERAVELGQAAAIRQGRGVPLTVALRDRLRLQGLDVDRMGAALGELGIPDTFERELMARVLGGDVEAWPTSQLDGVLAVLIGQLATLTPLVLVLEDSHPGLCRALVQRRVPVLVAQVGEPVEGVRHVVVPPLSDDEMNQLVHDALGLEPGLAARVVQAAAGNPGHAHRLVRSWVEDGALVASEHGFQLRPGLDAPVEDVAAASWLRSAEAWVAARGEADRRALGVAAVLGPVVEVREWTAVLDLLGVTPDPGLVDDLVDAQLAFGHPDLEWTFSHPELVRSLECGVGEDRQAILRGGADVALDSNRRATYLVALGPSVEALEALVDASRAHHQRGRMDQAARRMAQWEEVVDALGLEAPDERLVRGIVQRSAVRRILGHDGVGEDAVRDALGWVKTPVLRARALGELAAILGTRGLSDEARPLNEEARRIFLELGDHHRWAALAQGAVLIDIDSQRYGDAMALLDELLDSPRLARRVRAQLLRMRSTACLRLGDTEAAWASLEEALPLARAEGHARLIGAVANEKGMLQVTLDQLDAAEATFREAIAAYRLAGVWAEVVARLNLALLEDKRGRHQGAWRELEHLAHQPGVQRNRPMKLLVRLCLIKVGVALESWEAVDQLLDDVGTMAGDLTPAWTASKVAQLDEAIERAAGRPGLVAELQALREVIAG